MSLIPSPQLLSSIQATQHPIKLIRRDNQRAVKITPDHAYLLAKSGNFQGSGSVNRRVKVLIETENRNFEVDKSYWDERPVYGRPMLPVTVCRREGCLRPVERYWEFTKQDRRCMFCREHAKIS